MPRDVVYFPAIGEHVNGRRATAILHENDSFRDSFATRWAKKSRTRDTS
jgi:hypothetical protein